MLDSFRNSNCSSPRREISLRCPHTTSPAQAHSPRHQAALQTYANTALACVRISVCGVTCTCECTSVSLQVACVCSSRLFASLFVSSSCRANYPPTEPPLPSTPLPQHAVTETLPEIFNSVAAVNSTATLESMSYG